MENNSQVVLVRDVNPGTNGSDNLVGTDDAYQIFKAVTVMIPSMVVEVKIS